ncbi:MAG: outer membrane protein assembly factor BamB family protein, partial [Planctomycetota bacterium]
MRIRFALGLVAAALIACSDPLQIDYTGPTSDWPGFGGGPEGLRYSPLTQIDAGNVQHLELAWTHDDGAPPDLGPGVRATFQVNPTVIGTTLYYCNSFGKVFALDAETGAERWAFDSGLRPENTKGPPLRCRGLGHWRDTEPTGGASTCTERILFGTRDAELIALDARDGAPCADFGDRGRVSLREGMGGAPAWEYHPSSPPIVVGDVVVVGALVYDNLRVGTTSGVVRAYDVRTGALAWSWDPAPDHWKSRLLPGEKYVRGSPNVWSILSADVERGLVFVPTGNPSPDHYGGERDGLDQYGSSTIALDARTGELVWQFQTVHHDLWDFDVPAQPELFQIPGVGGGRPGVAQPTKMGFLFLLDRETGAPLYPVEERPVPQGGSVEAELLSPTQPFPSHPAPLHDLELEAWGFTPFDRGACEALIAKYRYEGLFTPPSLQGTIVFPHTAGGMNWGGAAIDPERGIAITNQTHVAQLVQLVSREEHDELAKEPQVFPDELFAMEGTPYGVRRTTLLSPLGAPCNKPPWGSLTALDLRSGEVLWKRPLGTTRDMAPFPLWLELGTPNFGGGIVTAAGLYWIGSTPDRFLRAFAVESGEEIWRARLPAPAAAIPATYRLTRTSKQFVVVASGYDAEPHKLLAFALPGQDGDAPISEVETTPTGKAIFVIEPSETGAQTGVREAIRREIAPRLAADPRVGRLVVNLPLDEEATHPVVASAIEVYGDAQALRALATELDSSLGAGARLHAYLVSERLPRRHVQDWPDGAPTPGVRMVALMVRDPQLSRAEFDAYWRDQHTPIALAHSVRVLHYSQNTVVERLTEGSDPIDGIVGEQFASPSY